MSRYYYRTEGIDRLKTEARERFDRLMQALAGGTGTFRGEDTMTLDGSKVRLAVDDFKNILGEIRRLK